MTPAERGLRRAARYLVENSGPKYRRRCRGRKDGCYRKDCKQMLWAGGYMGCCMAIYDCGGPLSDGRAAQIAFDGLYREEGELYAQRKRTSYYWPRTEKSVTPRVLALLFAAQMARTGDLPWQL